MQLANGLGIALPGVVSEPSEQDDTQLVKTSQQGDQDAFASQSHGSNREIPLPQSKRAWNETKRREKVSPRWLI